MATTIHLTGASVSTGRLHDPLPYTSSPYRLFLADVALFVKNAWSIPWTVLPPSFRSGKYDELHFDFVNMWTLGIHCILIVCQLLFILSLPIVVLLPLPASSGVVVLYIASFITVNWIICLLFLNGFETKLESNVDIMNHFPNKHDNEKFIFLNGIAAGSHWLQANIDRLSMSFGRPVTGVHNPTIGVIFDILECLLQRDFSFATGDIRNAYVAVKDALYEPKFTKVVFILHSQGGIEGGLVLDWLLADLPSKLLEKLEIYTFGCAANHFNNPGRLPGTICEHAEPVANGIAANGFTKNGSASNGYASNGSANNRGPLNGNTSLNGPERNVFASSDQSPALNPTHHSACRYIEHYAHTQEFVARWGVLHFDSWETEAGKTNRYRGRVFERDGKGHLLNQHYLNAMFPLDTKRGWGILEHNDFMDSYVDIQDSDSGEYEKSLVNGCVVRNLTFPLESNELSATPVPHTKRSMKKVGDFSRLWRYRNGRSVKD